MNVLLNEDNKEIAAVLFAACKHLNIEKITVTFDGSDDSGQIDNISFFLTDNSEISASDIPIKLGVFPVEVGLSFIEGKTVPKVESKTLSFSEAAEQIAYDLLEDSYGGWENDGGACGEFVFDVNKCTIELQINTRITQYHTEEITFRIGDETEN